MADLSLGPLRIANPDEASPDNNLRPQISQSTSSVSPLADTELRADYLSYPTNTSFSPVSPLEHGLSQSQSSGRRDSFERTSRDWRGNAYQESTQPQYPHSTSRPSQSSYDSHMNSSRPTSNYYPQPMNGNSSNGVVRQSSYRMHGDSSRQMAIPQRSHSRGSALGMQPGVTSGDELHSDRHYKQTQYNAGNGPVPPRRTSRGMGSSSQRLGTTPTGTTPLGGTPITHTPLSSSPYNIEGGPLSSSDDWQEKGAAVGVRQDYDAEGRPILRSIKKGVKDFTFGQTLGEGSYSTVLAAQDRQTGKDYAIKVLDKRHIIKEKKVKYVNIEKDTLNRLTDHPGVVRLYYTFQDERSLYFVLDLCTGGELLGVLKRMTTFDEECTRFYGAQILDTIEYMHSRGVIHRDLKPENVLLDDSKHIKITDFGTAKLLGSTKDQRGTASTSPDTMVGDDRASSFVGTAEYVSPELLTDKNACKASDLWAFGCIIYQLLAGRPPFKAANEYQTFQKIVALEYEFPRGFPEVARDLVERLLVLDPQRRLPIEHVKNHQFFEGVTWGRGLWQQKAPRLKTYIPPPMAPIKLNGSNSNETYPPNIQPAHSTHATHLPPNSNAPKAPNRIVTELPPPSQLDIEWSPVLTRNNERILKLGNLAVLSSQHPHSPHGGDGGSKLSRFFGGKANKKQQRLVMVTSSARIIIAAAGGEEKKSKSEIPLLAPGVELSSGTDSKGITQWVVNTVCKLP